MSRDSKVVCIVYDEIYYLKACYRLINVNITKEADRDTVHTSIRAISDYRPYEITGHVKNE